MASVAKRQETKRSEIEDLARHWAEGLAREAYRKGAGLDVSTAYCGDPWRRRIGELVAK